MNIHILSLLGITTIAQVPTATAQTMSKVNILFCVANDADHMSTYWVRWIISLINIRTLVKPITLGTG